MDLIFDQLRNKRKKKKVNFDLLVQREKFRLGSKSLTTHENQAQKNKIATQKKPNKKPVQIDHYSKTRLFYKELLEKNQFDMISKNDLIKINDLLTHQDLGNHPLFQLIGKSISKELKVEVQKDTIIQLIQEMNDRNTFQIDNDIYMNFKQLIDYLTGHIFLTRIIKDLHTENNPFINLVFLEKNQFIKTLAIKSFFLDKKYSPLSSLILKLSNPKNDDHFFKELLSESIRKRINELAFNNKNEIITMIQSRVDLLKIVYPISSIPKDISKKLIWAKSIFQLDSIPNEKDLKKKFLILAKERHPDKLSSMTKNKDLLVMANKNFTLINEAYETLKKHT